MENWKSFLINYQKITNLAIVPKNKCEVYNVRYTSAVPGAFGNAVKQILLLRLRSLL